MKRLWGFEWSMFLLMIFILFLHGCVNYQNQIVGQGHPHWNIIKKHDIYATQQRLFIHQRDMWHQNEQLAAAGAYNRVKGEMTQAPPSFSAYEDDPEQWPEIVGILESGTKLKIYRMRNMGFYESRGSGYPLAKVVSGEHKGLQLTLVKVINWREEDRVFDSAVPSPNEEFIRILQSYIHR